MEKADEKQKYILKKCLGNRNLKDRDIDSVRKIIISTGSLAYSQNLAADLIDETKEKIRKSPFKKDAKLFLLNLADYIVSRDK